MRTRRRENEREEQARREADRTERRESEDTVADPPRTVDDLVEALEAGEGLTYEKAALVGGIEGEVGGFEGDVDAPPDTSGW